MGRFGPGLWAVLVHGPFWSFLRGMTWYNIFRVVRCLSVGEAEVINDRRQFAGSAH